MFEQSEKFGRRKTVSDCRQQVEEKHAFRQFRQRLACGVVDLDFPAFQMGGNARCQRPVRRDNRHPLIRVFQRLTRQQRNDLRFLGAVARLDRLHPG